MLQAKLCTPRISKKIVRRKNIDEKLSHLPEYRLALISAPAGYGKTTAVISFLETAALKYAWFSIDDSDNDPVRFWNYIKTSISNCLKNEEIFSDVTVNQELVSSKLTADLLINTLSDVPEKLVLVLDDYHLINNNVILGSIEYFVKYMPPNLSVIILSRLEPGYRFSRMCSGEMAVRLGIMDLAFSREETSELFIKRGIDINPDEADALDKITEGWAAGLVAASISIKESGAADKSISSFSAKNHTISEMLENEVFSKLSAEARNFLVLTAFLDKLSGPLCAMVAGNAESDELLKALSEANSFIIPLDQDKTWFRYHHLFQEFLLQKLKAKGEPVCRSLFGLAGQWYQKNGYTQDAINCYLKAHEYGKAFPLVWVIYLEVAQNGEYSLWRKWIESMPEELCESDVRACTGYSWILSIENQVEKAHIWADKAMACFERIKDSLNKTERDFLEANIVLAEANVAVFRMDADSALRYYRRVYELGVATTVFVGEMNPGEPSLLETAYGFKGRLNKVFQVYENVIEDTPRVLGDFSAYFSAVLAECRYERNELKEVYSTLIKSMGRITRLRNPGIIVPSFISLAKLKRAQGDIGGALGIIQSGRNILGSGKSVWSYFFDVYTAELYLCTGDAESAGRWLSTDRVGIFDALSVSREFEYTVYAKYLIAEKRFEEALVLLYRLEDLAVREDRLGNQIEVLCLKAICADSLGETKKAIEELHKALELGFEDGYARTFIDLNQPMTELILKYKSWVRETGNSKHFEYAKNLLKLSKESIKVQKAAEIRNADTTAEESFKDLLSERESVVLKLMSEELSNKEIADRLFITVRTVKYYCTRIFDKLGVNNRLEAIIKAKELGVQADEKGGAG